MDAPPKQKIGFMKSNFLLEEGNAIQFRKNLLSDQLA
jgi:hypothetical protein